MLKRCKYFYKYSITVTIMNKTRSSGIMFKDINLFNTKAKHSKTRNAINNDTRESIIEKIINNQIPFEYYDESSEWFNLRTEVLKCLKKISEGIDYDQVKCVRRGGRKYNYDFEFFYIKNNEQIGDSRKIEFKFKNIPQFLSLGNPNGYLNNDYVRYHYDICIPDIFENAGVSKNEIPEFNVYSKQVHSTKPKCMDKVSNVYRKGFYATDQDSIKKYKLIKEITNKGIEQFIELSDIYKNKLEQKINETQQGKVFMVYTSNGTIETFGKPEYKISSIEKDPKYNSYRATLDNGNKIKILLRWKNYNGIAYPAFQISWVS